MPINNEKIKQINVKSDYYQDILDKVPSRITRWGSTGILVILILFCLGLKMIKYPDVITSDVTVTTATPPIEIYSRTSGRITHFLKKDQEKIKKGDWIIVLNNSADYNQVLRTINIIQKFDTADFWNTIDHIEPEEIKGLGDIQDAYSNFVRSIRELKFFIKTNAHYRQLAINYQRQKHLSALEQQLTDELSIQKKEQELAKIDYDRNLQLEKDSVISRVDLEQKEIAYLNMQNKVNDLNGTLINTRIQNEVLNKENATLKIEKDNNFFTYSNDVLKYYNDFLFQLSVWKNKYIIEAPIDGVLNLYDIRNEDQFLAEQTKVFTVAPEITQNYFAIIKLPISNSGKVRQGQKCIIKLNNYPYTEFGVLKGRIQSISLAAKEGFYSVKVDLPNQLMTNIHRKLSPKSELIGQADVVIEDLTMFDRLFYSLVSRNY